MGSQLPLKGAQPIPVFGLCLLWPNGLLDENATWYGSRPRPRAHCVRQEPSSPPRKGKAPLPLFGPCLLWPRRPSQLLLSSFFYKSTCRLLSSTSTIAICCYCSAQSRYKFSSPMEGSRRSRSGTAVRVYTTDTVTTRASAGLQDANPTIRL